MNSGVNRNQKKVMNSGAIGKCEWAKYNNTVR
jgi:hypothetical protein